jgi:serine/threonine-protein kinase
MEHGSSVDPKISRPMLKTLRYCHGCNEKFATERSDGICPVCDQRLASLAEAPTAEVLLTANVPATNVAATESDDLGKADENLVGSELGQYTIDRFIGRGGMARVYQATHRMLERTCAVKVLDPHLADRDPEYVQMFLDEARAAAALSHPRVVTIHNIGHDADRHYIEMEYVEGDSLQRLVSMSGRLAPVRAAELMAETCAGLAAAHQIGIVHRDFKPANILVAKDGSAKLADFGLAKRVHAPDTGPRSSELRGGVMVGTPYYMAPELFHRHPASKQSDVYAVGVTFYYILTSELPFVDTSLGDLARKHEDHPLPGENSSGELIPDDVLTVIRCCLAKNIDDRYADADELLDALRALYGNLRSLASLLREAFGGQGGGSGSGMRWSGKGNRYSVKVDLPSGRSQRVDVESSESGRIVDRLVRIVSVCAPLKESYLRRALELNAEVPHGSIAIQEFEGVPHFVMVNSYPRGSCDAVEIRKSVLEIARWADHVEKTLTGADRH